MREADGGLSRVAARSDERLGLVARCLQKIPIANDIANSECRDAVLPRAEELAGTAELEIPLRDQEAVRRLLHDREPLAGLRRPLPAGHEHAIGLLGAAP